METDGHIQQKLRDEITFICYFNKIKTMFKDALIRPYKPRHTQATDY